MTNTRDHVGRKKCHVFTCRKIGACWVVVNVVKHKKIVSKLLMSSLVSLWLFARSNALPVVPEAMERIVVRSDIGDRL